MQDLDMHKRLRIQYLLLRARRVYQFSFGVQRLCSKGQRWWLRFRKNSKRGKELLGDGIMMRNLDNSLRGRSDTVYTLH
jgi:hypothetical protein